MDFLKRNLFWISFTLLLFYSFSIFYRSDSSFDQDLGRHLKLGEIIVNTKSVPKINLFSYTNSEFPFINHHFLFEVMLYIWSIFFSLQSLLVVKIFLILIAIGLTLMTAKKSGFVLLIPFGYLFLHVLRERTDLRPEIFSFLFTSLTLYILEKYYFEKGSRGIFFLPLIQFFWVNIHIYFFLGFLLQGIYLIDFFIKKEFKKFKILLSIFGISLLAGFLNPNTIAGLLYPLNIFKNYGYTIAENQNIFLLESLGFVDHNFLFIKICAIIIIFSFSISLLKKPFSLKDNAISLLGLCLSIINIRSFPYLFFLSFPFVFRVFNINGFSKKINILIISSIILLIFESFLYLDGDYYRATDVPVTSGLTLEENAKNALDFVILNNLPQPIYNNFDIGSYIIYRGYPKYHVFVDGRPEAYPTDFFSQTYIPSQSNYPFFKELEKKLQFQTVIFSITDQTPWGQNFLKNIVRDEEWTTVYLDDYMIILVKKNQIDNEKLKTINLNELSIKNHEFRNYFSYLRLGYFLNNIGFPNSAEIFIKKAWDLNPESRIANSLMLYFSSQSSYMQKSGMNIWW